MGDQQISVQHVPVGEREEHWIRERVPVRCASGSDSAAMLSVETTGSACRCSLARPKPPAPLHEKMHQCWQSR